MVSVKECHERKGESYRVKKDKEFFARYEVISERVKSLGEVFNTGKEEMSWKDVRKWDEEYNDILTDIKKIRVESGIRMIND